MMRSRPLIGVTTSDRSSRTLWVFSYLAVTMAGGRVKEIKPGVDLHTANCDGFLITGGSDIDPALYNHENTSSYGLDKARDAMECALVRHAVEHGKPVFGICRGAQMINVAHNGTLHQNARDVYEGFSPHSNMMRKIYARRRVYLEQASLVAKAFGGDMTPKVNSLHHQSIGDLGQGLRVTARDSLGMVQSVEAGIRHNHYILGVQWHPELILYRPSSRRLFRGFVEACSAGL